MDGESKDIKQDKLLKRPKDIRGKIIEKDGIKYWLEEDWLRKEFGKYGTCHYEEIQKYKGAEKKKEIDEGISSGVYQLVKKSNGMHDLQEIELDKYFSYPKPMSLIKELVSGATRFSKDDNDIILDCFAGSSTTAQAVLELNKEDSGNRKFILVQMPEQCDESKAGYKTIADIGKERIRRVILRIKENTSVRHSRENGNPERLFGDKELDSRLQTAGMTKEDSDKLQTKTDLGFKVFKLSSSSFKIWRSSEIDSEEKLAQQLDAFTDPIRPGAEKQNMLYELMLKAGYELTSSVQYAPLSKGKGAVGYYSINNNELIIALDALNEKLIKQIIAAKPQKVITLDSLFTGNDQLKTNTVLQMRDAGVDFKTI